MPTKKYEWKPVDKAANLLIQSLVAESHLGYTGVEKASEGVIGYNRVRDLCLGLKAPARLSEFILICNVCHADPVKALQTIIDITEGKPYIMSVDAISDDVYADAVKYYEKQEIKFLKKQAAESKGLSRETSLGRQVTDDEIADTISKIGKPDVDLAAYHGDHKLDDEGDDAA